jgi:D-beta-D-heptose 7-phosphate kinase/D-beta-D-heptose 1-phosphate adenosyltransferase
MVAKYRHTTLLRVDQESRDDISEEQQIAIFKIAKEAMESAECRAVCIIDYCKGMITGALASGIIEMANAAGVKVFVDTKSRDIKKFAGAYLIKPNKHEFSLLKSLSKQSDSSDEDFCKHLYE